ncbi:MULTISPECIES: helix-turn-helix domain-containing protein [Shewanella]|uniref:Transcriptional regulator, XRE family n=1 Tax=Shewanella loihica (strain ATCC BAA-1088 / PV-4) TaxID=323850 RepID=A3QIQ8_SHELP|nr:MULTISPECIES: helix-turn-helix transcriptional regulator [Shewanella]ABO25356.1 transcriptional regulator, XRE family [Shewanella loihica PV-4]MCL1042689.1 helix-turn-helix domain-containing protein [Shewanella marisflavi]QYJ97348.1 helix-turn-helix domain-containing protein [Shewanella alkalitolerans]
MNVILSRFGQRLKQIRTQQRLSQEQLAEICELDRTYISGIERGVRNVALINIVKLANGLKVSASSLLEFDVETKHD